MMNTLLYGPCLHIAFYKGKRTWVSKLISWVTRSPYSHCELVFRDGMSFGIQTLTDRTGFFQTAYTAEEWDLVPITWVTAEQESNIRAFCRKVAHMRYDLPAMLLGWLWPGSDDPDKWFCSELCTRVLLPYTPSLRDRWYTPGSLYKALRDSAVFRA